MFRRLTYLVNRSVQFKSWKAIFSMPRVLTEYEPVVRLVPLTAVCAHGLVHKKKGLLHERANSHVKAAVLVEIHSNMHENRALFVISMRVGMVYFVAKR